MAPDARTYAREGRHLASLFPRATSDREIDTLTCTRPWRGKKEVEVSYVLVEGFPGSGKWLSRIRGALKGSSAT